MSENENLSHGTGSRVRRELRSHPVQTPTKEGVQGFDSPLKRYSEKRKRSVTEKKKTERKRLRNLEENEKIQHRH